MNQLVPGGAGSAEREKTNSSVRQLIDNGDLETDEPYISTMESFQGFTHEEISAKVSAIAPSTINELATRYRQLATSIDIGWELLHLQMTLGRGWTGDAATAATSSIAELSQPAARMRSALQSVGLKLDALSSAASDLKASIPQPSLSSTAPLALLSGSSVMAEETAREEARQTAIRAMEAVYVPNYTSAGTNVPGFGRAPEGPGDAGPGVGGIGSGGVGGLGGGAGGGAGAAGDAAAGGAAEAGAGQGDPNAAAQTQAASANGAEGLGQGSGLGRPDAASTSAASTGANPNGQAGSGAHGGGAGAGGGAYGVGGGGSAARRKDERENQNGAMMGAVPPGAAAGAAAAAAAGSAKPSSLARPGMGMGMPMMGAGARGAKGEDDTEHETPSYLVNVENGNELIGDIEPVSPPVIGA
ncbi:hypothetical protein [Rhodococcus sp. HNM0569]|uniref:hypothetical protein n=1 Tax=Rhodococcus sp. HNM0569 TaxID=2716340 RepID=UPI00146EA49A|nr:hypothetical protein [Rhodococcus sp. HNM0569]NLU84613.1 hypothetical protein [Rhodococcus sp. HNM0569]